MTILAVPELKQHIDKIVNTTAVIYNATGIYNWNVPKASFRSLPNIRKSFHYRISVLREVNDIFIDTNDAPNCDAITHSLLKHGAALP
eukprot:IDg4262t1